MTLAIGAVASLGARAAIASSRRGASSSSPGAAAVPSRRLAVPFGDLLIRRGPRRLGYRKCGVKNISGALGAICQAQQPVGTDPKRAGAFGNHLRIRQPCVAARQKLRNCRAINANRAGKFALID